MKNNIYPVRNKLPELLAELLIRISNWGKPLLAYSLTCLLAVLLLSFVPVILQASITPTPPSYTENFDGVAAPALPTNWSTSGSWASQASAPQSAPNRMAYNSGTGVQNLITDTFDFTGLNITNFDFSIRGTLTSNMTIKVQYKIGAGSWNDLTNTINFPTDSTWKLASAAPGMTIVAGAFDAINGQASVTFQFVGDRTDGTNSIDDVVWTVDGMPTPAEYNFMVEEGTVTFAAGTKLDVDGSIYISTFGSIIAENSSNAQFRLTKRWTSTGTFTAGDSSTVEFYNVTVSTIFGNTVFYNLKCETAGSTITFTAVSTQTVNGTLTLTGTDGSEICLRSSSEGSGWYIDNVGNTEAVTFVNVQDGNASSNDIDATNTINSGGNDDLEPSPHWVLPETNRVPNDIAGLTQLDSDNNIFASMQWSSSTVIISSFTLDDPNTDEQLKFYLHITSITTADAADWSQLFCAATSQYLAEGATGYQWPALTDKATYWWRVWCEDDSGAVCSATSTTLGQGGVAKLGWTPLPDAPSQLTQLDNAGAEVASMQWTTSDIIVSSFVQTSAASENLIFHLQVTSVTTSDAADWNQGLFVDFTSAALSQGTTGYQWPALTDSGTYWWQVWSESPDSGLLSATTSTTLGAGGTAKVVYERTFPEAIMTYYLASEVGNPKYREWTDSAWVSSKTVTDITAGADGFHVVRMCPSSVRNEALAGFQTTEAGSQDIEISTFTTHGEWGTAKNITGNCGTSATRVFDIAYEQTSGDGLIVYREGANQVPFYATWDGTDITDVGSTGLTDNGATLSWIRLVPKPGSNEIMLVYMNSNRQIYAAIWTGSAWGNEQALESTVNGAPADTNQAFDAAYHHSAGVGMAVWIDSSTTKLQYRQWDGTAWTAEKETNCDHGNLTTNFRRWVKLAANPKNNEMLAGCLTEGSDINVEVYSSTTSEWCSPKEVELTAAAASDRCFDVAYENNSGQGILVWGEGTANDIGYETWESGVWVDQGPFDVGGDPKWLALSMDDDTASDEIIMVIADDLNAVTVSSWSGTEWQYFQETNNSASDQENISVAFPAVASLVSDIIAPAAITSLSGLTVSNSSGTIQLAWSAPGDDVFIGRLTNGCQYQIRYCTSTDNRVWTELTAVSSPTASDTLAPETQLSQTFTNLEGDKNYYCEIQYYDGIQWSGWLSNEATAYARPQVLSVNIVETSYNFDDTELGISSQTQTTIQVQNDGTIIENFGIKCETNTVDSPWYTTGTSTETGINIFLLKAGFHSATMPAMNLFGNEDIISTGTYQTSQTQAGGGRFTIDGTEDGAAVPVNDTIDLWLRLDMPGKTDTIEPQEIILYIQAEEP